ncbi:GIY-YIG nuclease family protein [Endozoicomonas sp. Mp262]|uniref:GIY-YIG nuclease family protein n=1 Tax=Endozoicomonas sp. Mp262 TaxID=2919499 RepID=UPI0021DA9D5D
MAFYVYILRCSDSSYYTGHTDNLERRLAQHHARAFPDCYTANRRPVELVYQQTFSTREEALASERRIKGWSRKKKEAMMSGDWQEVSRLARRKPSTTSAHPEPVEGCKHSPNNNPCPNHPSTPLRVNGDNAHNQKHDD